METRCSSLFIIMRKTVVIALLFLVSGCVTKESLFDKDQNLSGTKVTRDFFGKRTIIWYDDQGIVTKKFSSTSGRSSPPKNCRA